MLAGCDSLSYSDGRTRLPDPFETVKNIDLQPRFPQQTETAQTAPKTAKSFSYFGQEEKREAVAEPAASGAHTSDNGEGYDLNFENASVTAVAKVILGDILGAGYTIDPRVQGTVTIASGRPVRKPTLFSYSKMRCA